MSSVYGIRWKHKGSNGPGHWLLDGAGNIFHTIHLCVAQAQLSTLAGDWWGYAIEDIVAWAEDSQASEQSETGVTKSSLSSWHDWAIHTLAQAESEEFDPFLMRYLITEAQRRLQAYKDSKGGG